MHSSQLEKQMEKEKDRKRERNSELAPASFKQHASQKVTKNFSLCFLPDELVY